MQRFKNVVVHRYGTLDDTIVFENLRKAPQGFLQLGRAFRSAADQQG